MANMYAVGIIVAMALVMAVIIESVRQGNVFVVLVTCLSAGIIIGALAYESTKGV